VIPYNKKVACKMEGVLCPGKAYGLRDWE